MYCSNCGVETTGKLCKACGVKQGANNNFCKFCGKEIEPNCKKCPNCNETVKVSGIFKLINIIKYPAAIVFLFFSVIGFISIGPLNEYGNMTKTIVCAVVIIVAVLLGLVVSTIITKKNNSNDKSRMISLPLIVVMIVVSSICCKMMVSENANLNATRDKEVSASEQDAYAAKQEAVEKAIQGAWINTSNENTIEIYAFSGNNAQLCKIQKGISAISKSSSFGINPDIGEIKCYFENDNVTLKFVFENDNISLTSRSDDEVKRISSAEVMKYLEEEEKLSENKAVICLADIIINHFADSEESSVATQKKTAAVESIKTNGEAALKSLSKDYDKVKKGTRYEHKNQPAYVNTTCYIYPYIYCADDSEPNLLIQLNYTDAQTNAGWIFFSSVTFNIDGENESRTFESYELLRDNYTDVWETANYVAHEEEIALLKRIANSEETIIRFQGSEYYADHTVTEKEKTAILDVLAAYEYLVDYSE